MLRGTWEKGGETARTKSICPVRQSRGRVKRVGEGIECLLLGGGGGRGDASGLGCDSGGKKAIPGGPCVSVPRKPKTYSQREKGKGGPSAFLYP